MREITSPWHLFNNTFPFTISLPIPLPIPLDVLSRFPCTLPILFSLPIPGHFLTNLSVLHTLAVVIVIGIARTAPSTTRRSGSRPVLNIIIFVNYLMPILWSNGQDVVWFVLPTAGWLNVFPGIITSVPRETVTSAFALPRTGFLRIGVIHLIPEGMGYPTSNCSFGSGFCETFAPFLSGRQPTTPEKANTCSSGEATSAGIVKSGKS
jgi:hypothetical protein